MATRKTDAEIAQRVMAQFSKQAQKPFAILEMPHVVRIVSADGFVSGEEKYVVAVVGNNANTFIGVGVAACGPKDTFDFDIGANIALHRAFRQYFNNVVGFSDDFFK